MFKRLLKHQLKTTWKEFNIAYGVIIFLGFLLAVAINSNSTPFIIVSTILFVFAIFAILTMLVNNSIKLLYQRVSFLVTDNSYVGVEHKKS